MAAFDDRAADYDKWYTDNDALYQAELAVVGKLLEPLQPLGPGLEVGAGSGCFAARLGIEVGLEPSPRMGELARKRGVDVVIGMAEDLPFAADTFGYVAFLTTLCFVNDQDRALAEARRVTLDTGGVVVAFLNRASEAGRQLDATKSEDPLFATARFFTPEELSRLLESAGYEAEEWGQVVPDAHGTPIVCRGADEGLYCVVRARLG